MALVTCYDPAGQAHQKEPIDAREACLHCGFTMSPPGEVSSGAIAVREPTKAELMVAHEQLVMRERELDEQAQRLAALASENKAEGARLLEQASANAAESQRLAAMAAVPPAVVQGADTANLTKEQLHAALDVKGIKYTAAQNKAELAALLGA